MENKKKEELTPEEYRQKAQDQIEHYKQQWKVFLRTGIFVLVALVAIIIACIAWFVSNSKVSISGLNIQAAGSEFDLAAAGTRENKGVYDNLLDVQPGTDIKLSDVAYASTDGEHTSVTWAITEDSNMNNKTETGINPGSGGSLTFYIISHKDGKLSVTLNLAFTGYSGEENAISSGDLTEVGEDIQQLLEGHILLFAGYDAKTNSYQNWISDDAGKWNVNLGTENNNISLSRDEQGNVIWSAENAVRDTAYPVTLYWIWPEILSSYLVTDQQYTGNRPILFETESDLPDDLYKKMCSTERNRYFLVTDQTEFSNVVTEGRLKQMRTDFNPAIYGNMSVYYNMADQVLGEKVRFLKLKLDAQ